MSKETKKELLDKGKGIIGGIGTGNKKVIDAIMQTETNMKKDGVVRLDK